MTETFCGVNNTTDQWLQSISAIPPDRYRMDTVQWGTRTQLVYIVFDIRSISSWLPLIKFFGGWLGLKGSEQRMRTLGFIVKGSIFSPASDAIFGYAYALRFERQLVITCIAEVDRDERMDYLYCHSTWGYFLLLLEGGLICNKGQQEGGCNRGLQLDFRLEYCTYMFSVLNS